MNDRQLEMRLTELLDGIYAAELAGADDILEKTAESLSLDEKAKARISSKALRKAGIVMKDSKNVVSVSKGRKRAAAMIVIAAAAALSVTAGAAVITGGFKGADADKAAESYFGEGHEALNEAHTDKTGHLKVREEISLCDGRNALVGITVEPLDEIGQGYIENSDSVVLNPITLISRTGGNDRFTCFGGGGELTADGCKVMLGGIDLSYKDPFNLDYEMPDDEVFDYYVSLNSWTESQMIEGLTGEPLSNLSFEVRKNAELISMTGDKGHTLEVSSVGLYINGLNHRVTRIADNDGKEFDDYTFEEIERPGAYGDPDITFEYSDGTTADIMDYYSSDAPMYLGNDDEYGHNICFDRPLDTDGLTGITVRDEHFTVEQK